MAEFRSDHDLPSVVDTDHFVVQKAAELLAAVVDFEIPGLGIEHDRQINKTVRGAHHWHRNIIMKAAMSLSPTIDHAESFSKIGRVGRTTNTRLHDDLGGVRLTTTYGERLRMLLRLHTANQNVGARVSLTTSRPGLGIEAGDRTVFHSHFRRFGAMESYGYESARFHSREALLLLVEQGTYEPLVCEPRVYHFAQSPLSSVLFRSMTSIGPSSPHAFSSEEKRAPFISNLTIFAQSVA